MTGRHIECDTEEIEAQESDVEVLTPCAEFARWKAPDRYDIAHPECAHVGHNIVPVFCGAMFTCDVCPIQIGAGNITASALYGRKGEI